MYSRSFSTVGKIYSLQRVFYGHIWSRYDIAVCLLLYYDRAEYLYDYILIFPKYLQAQSAYALRFFKVSSRFIQCNNGNAAWLTCHSSLKMIYKRLFKASVSLWKSVKSQLERIHKLRRLNFENYWPLLPSLTKYVCSNILIWMTPFLPLACQSSFWMPLTFIIPNWPRILNDEFQWLFILARFYYIVK